MGPTHRLAIDLGTCHTVAVVRRGDDAPRALLFDGSPVMASGIYADESGKLSVGRDAERLSQLAPSRFEPYPKRSVDEGAVLLGDTEVTVVEMLSALLKRVADESLQAGVNPVGSTVLTCPADWGGQRRNVLLEAARAANLGPVVLVDEPIAAATYCLRVLGQQVAPLQSLAVFDFGGGTLDVSVVRREPAAAGGAGGLRVLGVGGLDDLGGVDIDAALVGHLGQLISLRNPEIWQRLANPDSIAAHRDRRALWTEVRAAKEMLSRAASAPIHVPGTEEALHITREELERVAGPLIDRAVDETRRVLERAGVDVRQLAGIFLVGGSSRIPLVASRLHARFGVAPVVPEQPELPVAYGGMLAVATSPQQLFDGGQSPAPRPVSGTPVSPSGGTSYPVSVPIAGIGGSSSPTSPGAYGSPAGVSQTFNAASPSSPAAFVPNQSGRPGGPGFGGPAAFGATAPPGVRPAPGGPGLARPDVPAGIGAPGGFSTPGGQPGQGGPGFSTPGGPSGPGFGTPGGPPGQGGFGATTFPPGGQPAFTPPPPVIVRPRRSAAPWIALVIVLSLIGGCLWGGSKVFTWIGDQFESVKDSLPGDSPTGDDGKLTNPKVDGLQEGKPITVDGAAGGFTALAGAGVIYTAESTAESTKVTAYPTLGDQATWTVSVPMAPKELRLSLVGGLLLVDGDGDTKRSDNDSRSVIDVATGGVKWTAGWDNRIDLQYLRNGTGIDAVTEVRSNPSSVQRFDLLTGKSRWTHPGEKSFFINGQRRAKAAGTWTRSADAGDLVVPTYEKSFAGVQSFAESLGADPATVVHVIDDNTVTLVNIADGKTKASAPIKGGENDFFMAYGGAFVSVPPDAKNTIVGYSLRDLSKMWEFKAPPGVEIEDVRPCGEKLICLALEKSLDYTITAVNVGDGKQAWTKQLGEGDEPSWYVVDGKLLLGEDSGGDVSGPSICDPANGNVKYGVAESATSPTAMAASGGRIAVRTLRISGGASVWQVSVADLGTGKVIGAADVSGSSNTLTTITVSADSVTAISDKERVIHRYSIPKK
ncbi:Hsp70 family protein [Dactylosporangium sp. NPDC050588]|uniref:Hsp70 family protein n=1 Tax=Dactylosporangium sp. NPDC050588 TaxID=3157211 RepID=UPI00340B3C4B